LAQAQALPHVQFLPQAQFAAQPQAAEAGWRQPQVQVGPGHTAQLQGTGCLVSFMVKFLVARRRNVFDDHHCRRPTRKSTAV
jgi:hypothetical protein